MRVDIDTTGSHQPDLFLKGSSSPRTSAPPTSPEIRLKSGSQVITCPPLSGNASFIVGCKSFDHERTRLRSLCRVTDRSNNRHPCMRWRWREHFSSSEVCRELVCQGRVLWWDLHDTVARRGVSSIGVVADTPSVPSVINSSYASSSTPLIAPSFSSSTSPV